MRPGIRHPGASGDVVITALSTLNLDDTFLEIALSEPGVGSIPDPRARIHDHILVDWQLRSRQLGDVRLVESRADWRWLPR